MLASSCVAEHTLGGDTFFVLLGVTIGAVLMLNSTTANVAILRFNFTQRASAASVFLTVSKSSFEMNT
jgi:hypothetical protein